MEKFTLDSIQNLKTSGLYFLYENNILVYIGISRNIYNRVLEHNFNGKIFDSVKMYENLQNMPYTALEIIEVLLISKACPKYNKLKIDNDLIYIRTLPTIAKEEALLSDSNIEKVLNVRDIILKEFL